MAKKNGRPAKYSEALAKKLCLEIATSKYGIHKICKQKGFPGVSTIFAWLQDERYKDFQEWYARARQLQAELLKDEMISVAYDSSKDTKVIETRHGEIEVEDKEWTSRSRLKVDTLKFIASKLWPKVYGEKLDLTTQGDKLPAATSPGITVIVQTQEQKAIVDGIK